jgi:hypothetical protein
MPDYAAWVQRLRDFSKADRLRNWPGADQRHGRIEVAPPLDAAGLKALEEECGSRLPLPLREFLSTGASSITFRWFEPEASEPDYEVVFCPAEELASWRLECIEYAQGSWLTEPEWPLDYALWRHGWLQTHDEAGDGLAIWANDRRQPHFPLAYLDHEDTSYLVAPTFDDFLEHWERLGYLDLGEVLDFRDPETGFLDTATSKARAYRKAVGLEA